jgi:nucleotide-binding universal stress UspA family protein
MASNNETKDASASAKASGPVLVALDFTPDSRAALLWACRFGKFFNSRILALHVIHDPGDAPGYYRKAEGDLLRPLEEVAADMMKNFLADLRHKHPQLKALKDVEPVLVKGIPATRIIEVAKAENASLIVLGSQGRTGLPHLLLGSKAQRVAQLAPMPVTIVKAPRESN